MRTLLSERETCFKISARLVETRKMTDVSFKSQTGATKTGSGKFAQTSVACYDRTGLNWFNCPIQLFILDIFHIHLNLQCRRDPFKVFMKSPIQMKRETILVAIARLKVFLFVDGVFFLSNDGEKKITSRTHDSDVADKLNSHSSELTNYMLLK